MGEVVGTGAELATAERSAPIAEIRALRVEVGGRALVDGVDLRIAPGTVTALVGASGSGKTTTGLALLGEYPAGARVTGDVRVPDGLVGYVPQHPAAVLNPARRVSALLRDIARTRVRHLPRGQRREAARERMLHALELVQLPGGEAVLRRYPHQLSGGQQQRVVLAQALLLGARVIVADEPTTGQDALTKRHLVRQFDAVAREGVALVLLSHDLHVVRDLADEVLVLREGRVVESGPAERVWRAPRHAWTRELTAQGDDVVPAARQTAETAETADGAGVDRRVVLRVSGLRAGYPGAGEVLRVPALELRSGECLAVIGRSGSGKTTLARCLAGLHRDFDGELLLEDGRDRRDGRALPRRVRDRDTVQLAAVQYVFQDARAAFDEERTALDQVARTAVRLRGASAADARTEALATLGRLGLAEDAARRPAGLLSGGELQRAALARALLARPKVLLCDEITSGLDAVTQRALLRLLVDLLNGDDSALGLSLVLVTHDLEAAALADRVAVLDEGAVVEQGPASRVLGTPQHPFTSALLRAADPRARVAEQKP